MSTKSHTHKSSETLRKNKIYTIRYADIHKQRPFFDNRKDISKIVVLKILTVSTSIDASLTHRLLVS
jgi:hypothetical protein